MRTLAVCLDGYEESVGRALAAEGLMPHLAALEARAAHFALDHGADRLSGLGCEHFASGRAPADSGRQSAVEFDPTTYAAWKEGALLPPFPARLPVRTAVFDPGYYLLAGAESAAAGTRGVVGWGAHDPGVRLSARPAELLDELVAAHGRYPADGWLYATPWGSEDACREMGAALAAAAGVRAGAAAWLLGERLPDWDLALVGVSEAHSVLEGLWHGIDPAHPLFRAPSARAARAGVRAVYGAIDALLGRLAAIDPGAALVVFSMHGMGANRADAASMLLLPELLWRRASARPYFDRRGTPVPELGGAPALDYPSQSWSSWVAAGFGPEPPGAERLAPPPPGDSPDRGLGWVPAMRYRRYWPQMDACALPSFYDGRVRVNLAGRELRGRVAPADYCRFVGELVDDVRRTVDSATGLPVVEDVELAAGDPLRRGPSDCDVMFRWRGAPLGFAHPSHGQIGPVPYRRTGGHASPRGFALVAAPGLAPGARAEVRSSHDVAPTIALLLGLAAGPELSGKSLLGGDELRTR